MSLAIPLLLAVAIAVPAVWWISERPHYIAAVLAFCVYTHVFQVMNNFHGFPPLLNASVVGVLGLVALRWLLLGESAGSSWRAAAWFYGAWCGVALGSLLVAIDTEVALQGLEEFAQSALLMLAMPMLIRTREGVRSVLWALVFAGLFLGGITAFQHLTGDLGSDYGGFAKVHRFSVSGDVPGGRAMGPTSTNYFGLFLVVLVPIAMDRAVVERRIVLRGLAAISAFVISLAIYFTFSRGAALALVVVVLLSLLRTPIRYSLAAAGAASLLLLASFGTTSDIHSSRLSKIGEVFERDDTDRISDRALRGRLSEMTAAVEMFADHPWFGVGHWNYNPNYGRYAREIGLDARNDRSAHSLYLEVAAETGAVGLLVFLTLYAYVGWSVVSARANFLQAGHPRDASAVTAFGIGLVGFLVGSFFLHLDHEQYMWTLLGIGIALPEASRYRLPAESPHRSNLRFTPAHAGVEG